MGSGGVLGKITHSFRQAPKGRVIALVIWVAVIWGHSLAPGEASSEESGMLLQLLMPLLRALGANNMELAHTALRKCGHFSEYLVLGVLAWRACGPAGLAAVLAVGIAAPCIDETIQLFVPGRHGAALDVLIDMAGFATGLLACRRAGRRAGSPAPGE